MRSWSDNHQTSIDIVIMSPTIQVPSPRHTAQRSFPRRMLRRTFECTGTRYVHGTTLSGGPYRVTRLTYPSTSPSTCSLPRS